MTTTSTPMAAAKINPKDLSALHRQMNKTLFVSWINADLMNRFQNDVDKSTVFYDANKDFVFATRVPMSEELWEALITSTPIRFWSAGVR